MKTLNVLKRIKRDIISKIEKFALIFSIIGFNLCTIVPSLTVAKESRAHKRRNYTIYELLFSF